LVIEQPLVDLVTDLGQRLPVGVVDDTADAEVVGVVDRRLGSERAALLEVTA